MNGYAVLKFVHIVSSTVLFGTGLGTAFFMWMTHRSGNIAAIATATRITVRADWLFTTPAVVVQPLSGIGLMWLVGYPLMTSWLLLAIGLYLLAGACWLPVVALQLHMRELSARALRDGTALPAAYHRCMRWWFALGWPAFIAVLSAFWLMVAKPQLW
jgi:uncharacterized membrane protein